ncbi:UDP-N-acetylmuramate dehydrogenase [Patescibacteria group bacterium]|nr:UDP-N-acetylmuramate dehydrogenase [Patescibacteria group bacterium]MBU1728123.1 UDP-N-acetylmuramate dehydrogenase [Patescibacteria group bacterium]
MKIKQNYDLTKLNTFGISAKAKYFVEISKEKDLGDLFSSKEFKNNKKLFLGGGSNVLFTKDFDGIVVLNGLKGIEILKEDENSVFVKSASGEFWNDLVNFATDRGYWGIENLSLIPGTVGGAPIQNIGAYGTEVKDIIDSVEVYDSETGEKKVFQNSDCKFGYRDSIFKNKLKGKYFISAVIFKLSKIKNLNVKYKALKDYLENNKLEIKNSKDISNIVAQIRKSKLPDPKILGNAGSFFKNIYVDSAKLEELKRKYSDLPYFEEGEGVKIPAGWLIEKCGPANSGTSWKGYRIGNVGVYEKQALVLVNYGGATGEEVKNLVGQIIDSVFEKFGLKLVPEVNLI